MFTAFPLNKASHTLSDLSLLEARYAPHKPAIEESSDLLYLRYHYIQTQHLKEKYEAGNKKIPPKLNQKYLNAENNYLNALKKSGSVGSFSRPG